MKEQSISFDTAKLANEVGIFLPCSKAYFINKNVGCASDLDDGIIIKDTYPAPTQSLLQKWLREEHKLHVAVYRMNYKWCSQVYDIFNSKYLTEHECFDAYEEAMEYGLYKALTLINNDKQNIHL